MPEGDASSTNGSGLFANEIVALAVLFCSSTITMIAAARECDVPTLHVSSAPANTRSTMDVRGWKLEPECPSFANPQRGV